MMGNVIDLAGLKKNFGEFEAVKGIDLVVPKGGIHGLIGPNGAGKSTTIKMICGVLEPSGGTGTVLGLELGTESEKIKEKIGYMSQKFSLYEDLTVAENIEFYSEIYTIDLAQKKGRTEEILRISGLGDRKDQLVGTLSGGWKQKLALSCCLIHKPELLILDEPTAGVDPVSRRLFWKLIHEIVREGVTVLATTHYMDEAEGFDSAAFIMDGSIIAADTTAALMEKNNVDNLEDVFIKYALNGDEAVFEKEYKRMKRGMADEMA